MDYKVVLKGFPSKRVAQAFIDWYLNQGEDEFNTNDTWQEKEGEGIWGYNKKQDLQWDNDIIVVNLIPVEGGEE